MKSTLKVTPYHDENSLSDFQDFYMIELNIRLDSTELVDVSYIASELTKCVKQMEFSLEQAERSRKLAKGVKIADTDSVKGDSHDK